MFDTSRRRNVVTELQQAEASKLLTLWRERHKRTQAEFADHFGLGSQANVGHYLHGRTALNLKAAAAFADELGCKIEDFAPSLVPQAKALLELTKGLEKKASEWESEDRDQNVSQKLNSPESIGAWPQRHGKSDLSASGERMIPQFDTGGAMGATGLILADQPGTITSWGVTAEWANKNLPYYTAFQNLAIVTGFGDSMLGMFNPGDPLLVDTGITKCDVDGVFFFSVDGEGFIKRLQRIPGEGILVISENKKYRDWMIKPSMSITVFAKVLIAWEGKRY